MLHLSEILGSPHAAMLSGHSLRLVHNRVGIRWRHGQPSYLTRNFQSHKSSSFQWIVSSHTGERHLSPKLPNIILGGFINISLRSHFQSTAASTVGWFNRWFFWGNARRQHTIRACFDEEKQQNTSLTILQGLESVQLAQKVKTNVSLPVPSGVGMQVQTDVKKCLPVSQASPDDVQIRNGTHAVENVAADEAGRGMDENWIEPGKSGGDPALVMRLCFILEQYGWGPRTEEKLLQIAERITSDVVTSVVSRQRNANLALSFLEWAGRQAGCEHRAETFTKVIGRLGKDKDFRAAWNVLETMKKHGLDVNYAFSVFVHRLKRAHLVGEVIKAMDCMRDLNVTPTVPLYTLALKVLLKETCLVEAQRLYLQMLQSGLKPDKPLYGVLISGFGMAGELNKALHFFEEMKIQGLPPGSFIYTTLIRSHSMAGKYDEGHKLYKEMIRNDCWPEVFTQHDLTCALHGKNTMEQIGAFLQDVDTKGHVLSIFTYNNMLKYLLDSGRLCEAVDFFHMLSGKPRDVDGSPQNLTNREVKLNLDSYTLIIFGLCNAEKVVEAWNIFDKMLASGLKPTDAICDNLLLCLSNAGLVDEAFELCNHIVKLKMSVSLVAQRGLFNAIRAS